jgi:hypothetical protein
VQVLTPATYVACERVFKRLCLAVGTAACRGFVTVVKPTFYMPMRSPPHPLIGDLPYVPARITVIATFTPVAAARELAF